ncbi:unnamed protein product [Lasius platythorax]|uniref:Uncharacterized protein n=1 Tax=Lasius platythorax TaxID=488582 RepID=A0AAV2P5Z6_9HYME
MLSSGMSGGESSGEEKERGWQRKTRKRSETKTGLNVRGITEVWAHDGGEGKGGTLGTRRSGYRSIPGLIRTIFRSRGREAIFFPGSVDEKRLHGQDATPK